MSVFEPIVGFVGKLPFRSKLRMFALVFGVPLFIITAVLLEEIHSRVAALEREQTVLEVQAPALALVGSLNGLAATLYGIEQGGELEARLAPARAAAAAALAQLKTRSADLDIYRDRAGDDKHLLGNWDRIVTVIERGDQAAVSDLNTRLRTEIESDVGQYGLLTDSDFATSRLLDVISTHLPGLITNAGLTAQVGTDVLIKKSIRGNKRNNLTVAKGNLNALTEWSMDNLRKVSAIHPQVAPELDQAASQLNTAFARVQEMTTIKMLDTADFDMTPAEFLDISTDAIDKTVVASGLIVAASDQLLSARLNRLRLEQVLVLIASLITLGMVATGFVAAYISIMRGLRGLSDAVETMAAGDLAARVTVSSHDEIGEVGHRFNEMATSLAERTEQLRAKTNDINAMLHTLPQGILTIQAGGTVHPEYSSYLERILEADGLADKQATALLFDGADLGADARSAMEASIVASIGEDEMNFEFNAHLLPGEVRRTMPDGRVKILEFTWSPISNEDGIVEKIMVCVRDVTEIREIMAEADHQRRELEMIGQILRVPQEKFEEFVEGSRNFVAENTRLITEADAAAPELVAHLFRNMHTIKGNARTYGLLHLTNLVHETEQTYQAMRDSGTTALDRTLLLAQLQEVSARLEEYAHHNTVTLGRTGPGRRRGPDKFLMVPREQIDGLVAWLRAYDVKAADRDTLAAALEQVRADLDLLGTEALGDVLAPVTGSLPDLARELGKEPPQIAIVGQPVRIRNQAADLLRNAFTHLYRNAVDHGLEAAEERRAAGKSTAGTVSLAAEMQADRLLLTLTDDGRGLAVAKIRARALERGLIGDDGSEGDEAVARLIFASGFSTAVAVTEVSGRGVGMDAVRAFLKSVGGDIDVHLQGGSEGDPFRPCAMLISLPAALAAVAHADVSRGVAVPTPAQPSHTARPGLLEGVLNAMTGHDAGPAKA